MGIETSKFERVKAKLRFFIFILFFGAIAFLLSHWTSAFSTQRTLDNGVFAASDACKPKPQKPGGCREQLSWVAKRAPLSADPVAGLVRIEREAGGKGPRVQAGEKLLAEMGFRSTLAQQLLLTSALERRDFVEILMRSDALLRREKLEKEVLPIMLVAAGDQSTREPLITALAREPNWRLAFMTHPGGFARADLRAARAEVLDEMITRKIPTLQVEVAHALRALAGEQENEAAYRLWKKYRGLEGRTFSVFDPRFEFVARDRGSELGSEIPFEWRLLKGRGYRAQLRESTKQNNLTLSWNGRGSPTMLEQKVRLEDGKAYNLQILASDPASVVARRFTVSLDCPGLSPVQFADFRPAAGPGRPETVEAENAIQCDFPVLRIRGNAVDAGDRGGRTSISYLALKQVVGTNDR